MKKKFTVLLALSLFTGLLTAAEAAEPHTISVTGRGEVSCAADTAVFNATVETDAMTQEAAASENAARSKALRTALIAAGAEFDRLSTENYSVNPMYRYGEKGKRTFLGYRVQNRLQIRVSQLSRVGTILDAAVKNGADRIDSVDFMNENKAVYRNRAYLAAGEDARKKAAAAAGALGMRLGRVLSVSENSYSAPRFRNNMLMAASMKAETADAATPIEAEEETLRTELSVVYEML